MAQDGTRNDWDRTMGDVQYAILGDYNSEDVWAGRRRNRLQTPDQYAAANTFDTPESINAMRMAAMSMLTDGGPQGGEFQAREGRGGAMAALAAQQALSNQQIGNDWRGAGYQGLQGTNEFEMRRQALREMLRQQELNRQRQEDDILKKKRDLIGQRISSGTMKGVSSGMAGGSGGGGNDSGGNGYKTWNEGNKDNPWYMSGNIKESK